MAEETDKKTDQAADIDIDDDDDLDAAFDADEAGDIENVEDVDDDSDDEGEDEGDDDQPPAADGEEVDDEDPSDVEDDLGTILKERLVAEDEDEDELEPEDADLVVQQHGESPDEQFLCMGCFLKVSASQFGEPGSRVCPNGEDPCPSVELLGG